MNAFNVRRCGRCKIFCYFEIDGASRLLLHSKALNSKHKIFKKKLSPHKHGFNCAVNSFVYDLSTTLRMQSTINDGYVVHLR